MSWGNFLIKIRNLEVRWERIGIFKYIKIKSICMVKDLINKIIGKC